MTGTCSAIAWVLCNCRWLTQLHLLPCFHIAGKPAGAVQAAVDHWRRVRCCSCCCQGGLSQVSLACITLKNAPTDAKPHLLVQSHKVAHHVMQRSPCKDLHEMRLHAAATSNCRWRDTPVPTRARVMLKFQELIRKHTVGCACQHVMCAACNGTHRLEGNGIPTPLCGVHTVSLTLLTTVHMGADLGANLLKIWQHGSKARDGSCSDLLSFVYVVLCRQYVLHAG